MSTITSTTSGYVLNTPRSQNPSTVANSAVVTNTYNDAAHHLGDAIYGTNAAAWTITNYGTVSSNPTAGNGIELAAGGFVSNVSTGVISGNVNAVLINGTAGTVINAGSIGGGGGGGNGINLGSGGLVNNSGQVSAVGYGVFAGGALTTVINSGTIKSLNDAHLGVAVTAGGYVTNQSTGYIYGGVSVDGGLHRTIVNLGTISRPAGRGVYVHIGYINNAGLITGSIGAAVNYGTLVNAGSITGTAIGVSLTNGGFVSNTFVGTISGGSDGILAKNSATTLLNSGGIEATGTKSTGVYLGQGGYVDNEASGFSVISATAYGADALVVNGAVGTVINHGTITGYNLGVWLEQGGTVNNTGSVVATGTNGDGVSFGNAGVGAGTLFNSGHINAPNLAVWLEAGGYVSNTSTGTITGGSDGVLVQSGTATVVNAGTIKAAIGIHLSAGGGYISNAATGYISAPQRGVQVDSQTATVVNAGTILSFYGINLIAGGVASNTGTISGTGNEINVAAHKGTGVGTVYNGGTILATKYNGIYVGDGGTITNSAGAIISASTGNGITFANQPVTVINHGTLESAAGRAVRADGGGTIGNFGLIETGSTQHGAVSVHYHPVTVFNSGVISGGGPAVYFQSGGYVYNSGGAVITGGSYGGGVAAVAGAATVVNKGTIVGAVDNAMSLGHGGTVSNSGSVIGKGDVVLAAGSLGTVLNTGSILDVGTSGAGVDLAAGGYVSNSAAGVISAPVFGVEVNTSAGTVINHGSIYGSGGASPTGIYLGSGGSVDNFGIVRGISGVNAGIGINFAHGGTLTNESGALITAGIDGVVISGTYGSVNNLGTIAGGTDGVVLKATGASLTNSGQIVGTASYGVYLYAGGSATNALSGLIEGAYEGILSTHTAANVVNFGTVLGTGANGTGVRFAVAGSTLTNAGMIGGNASYAVKFTGGGNRLIIDPGEVLSALHAAYGGNGAGNVLELGSGVDTGVIGGIGPLYVNFGTVAVDGGANWVLSGANTIASGGTLLDFGTLTNTGSLVATGAQLIVDPGTLVNSGYVNTTVTLDGGSYLDNTTTGRIVTGGTSVLGLNSPNTVVNAGSIIATGSPAYGIRLLAGGIVTNAATGYISGANNDIVIGGGLGSVVNSGLLATSIVAVRLLNGGSVTNAGTGSISASLTGVEVDGATGTLDNASTISGTGTASGAVYLTSGGYVINRAGGLLTGAVQGVAVGHGTGTVNNGGTIKGTGTLGGGIYLNSGGLVTNASTALVAGTTDGVLIGHSAGTVSNLGTIAGTGNSGIGVELNAGGIVSNSGTIGGYSNGVMVGGGYGSISNLGRISASGSSGASVFLAAGGSITNGNATITSALIVGSRNALAIFNAAGSVTNYGTLAAVGSAGYGAVLSNGGTVTNFGTILETGSVGNAVRLGSGGVLTNNSGALIAGGGGGVYVYLSTGTVGNAGTIASTRPAYRDGVLLSAGGTVSNASTGLIKGLDGVDLRVDGTVTNAGTIVGYGNGNVGGIFLGFNYSPGAFLVTNSGLITSTATAVRMRGDGSVNNQGTIQSTSSGNGDGVYIAGLGTVTNTGTIAAPSVGNGTAVSFGVAGGTLVNQNGGLITAYHDGVGFFPGTAAAPGTLSLVNHGTILSTQQSTVVSTGFSGWAVIAGTNGMGIVDNFGTIAGGQTLGGSPDVGGGGIDLNGGSVINEAGGLISAVAGIAIASPQTSVAALNVDNSGVIENVGSSHSAIYLGHGGVITNRAGALILSAAWNAINVDNTIAAGVSFGSVVNYGTIIAIGTAVGAGVRFGQGGILTNQAKGLISAYRTGVYVSGGPGTVVNYGAIINSTSASPDVRIVSGGTVLNHGLIASLRTGVSFGAAAGTVDNFGIILSTAATSFTAGAGIYLQAGGLITNEAAASVVAYRAAIALGASGATTTVTNRGLLHGNIGVLIDAADTGNTTIDNFGAITGTGGTAISLGGGADLVILEKGSTLSGGIANFAPGDTLDLPAVPFATSDTVTFSGTTLTVSGGGVTQSVTLLNVAAATDFILESDGGGGVAIGPVVSGSGIAVLSGQILTVLSGQTVSNVTVESGGVLDVASGGTASAAIIQSGGVETVFSGGKDSGTTIQSGGFEDVYGGGSAVATQVLNGGSQTIEPGGSATGVMLDGAALQNVSGFAGGTKVGAGDEQLIEPGGVASGTTVAGGGSEIVLGGGLTSNTTIAGGSLELQAGAAAGGTIGFTSSGGTLRLDSLTPPAATISGLTTSDTIDFRAVPFGAATSVTFNAATGALTVASGGTSETVKLAAGTAVAGFLLDGDGAGGTAVGAANSLNGLVLSSGQTLTIEAGQTASNIVVLAGATLDVGSGGTAIGVTVSNGGNENVLSGGVDSGATILNGGNQTVEQGGVATGADLDGVALQKVFGVAISTVVSAGDEQLVESGGLAHSTTVLSGGALDVASGGAATAATIKSGGVETVFSGGTDSGTTIQSGGFEDVFGGGSAIATVVLNGGSQTVEPGGSATGVVLDGAGLQTVSGFAGGTAVGAGDEQLIEPGGVASGTTVSGGGSEIVAGGGLTSNTTIAGGSLELQAGAAASGTIGFAGSGGTLRLDGLPPPAATIGGFASGDAIDLPLIGFAASDTATLGANNLLTVSGGGESVTLQFDSSVAGKGFAISDDGSGGVRLTLTQQTTTTSLYDFVFIYNDGQDYYLGTVADDGRFGYAVGQKISTTAGTYDIFGKETAATSEAAGSVSVVDYSHGGPGASSGIPVKTAAKTPDGTAGLGSESDTLLGLDGQSHAFSSTQEAAFATTSLYGFVYTYADGAAYTGTVADNSSGGLPSSETIKDSSNTVLGVYTIFSEGLTTRPSGTVVIDRFLANGTSVLANHDSSAAVDGTAGLGSEAGSLTIGRVTHDFSPTSEPVVTGNAPTMPVASTPAASDVITNEVDLIYYDIVGRFPSQSEFDTASGELAKGTSVASVRGTLAGGSESQDDVQLLYQQLFGRAANSSEVSDAAISLTDGSSLASLQQVLANSSEAASDINGVYLDVLGRSADPSGLASFTAALADETPTNLNDPGGLPGIAGVRDVLAHSGEAADALTTLFQGITGRAPSTAELVGMEDQLATAGNTQNTLQSALSGNGSAGGDTTITVPGGAATLSAATAPSLFQFSDVAFNATITGFDPTRDTVQLPKALVADFATVENDTAGASGGSLITLNSNHSIFLSGVAPNKLAAGNFLIL